MRITIKSMSVCKQHIDENISHCKTFLSQVCPPILFTAIIAKIRLLNSKLCSFLYGMKASKLAELMGSSTSSSQSINSSSDDSLVVTIPSDLPLSDSERSVLAKGLKFVPNSQAHWYISVKEDTEAFFHDQSPSNNKDIYEQINARKSSWSPPEDQFSSLDLFIRQCWHDINKLRPSHPNKSTNLTKELLALKSLCGREDIVIKPADKGGAAVVWRADLYRQEALCQLNDTTLYSRLDSILFQAF